jgi:hypothetical protein
VRRPWRIIQLGRERWSKSLRRASARGEITGEQARFVCASLRRCFTGLHRSEALVDRAIGVAFRLRHPIYDCLYLACTWPAPNGPARVWSPPTGGCSPRSPAASLRPRAVHLDDFAA